MKYANEEERLKDSVRRCPCMHASGSCTKDVQKLIGREWGGFAVLCNLTPADPWAGVIVCASIQKPILGGV